MQKMKISLKITLLAVAFCATTIAFGQPAGGAPPGGPSGGTPPCWPPPCVPIDGGISFLIAIGAAFGGKKAYDFYKKK